MVSTGKKQQIIGLVSQLDGFNQDILISKSAKTERQNTEVRGGQADPEFISSNNNGTEPKRDCCQHSDFWKGYHW